MGSMLTCGGLRPDFFDQIIDAAWAGILASSVRSIPPELWRRWFSPDFRCGIDSEFDHGSTFPWRTPLLWHDVPCAAVAYLRGGRLLSTCSASTNQVSDEECMQS